MPLISTLANASARGYGMFGGAAAVPTDYQSIATQVVGSGGSSSVSFTSIPSTYKHLQIRGITRTSRTVGDVMDIVFNSSSGNVYSGHLLEGNGSTTVTDSLASFNYWFCEINTAISTMTSDIFGNCVIDILDYADTNKYKTMRGIGGVDANGSGAIDFVSGSYQSTSAVSSITFYPHSRGTFSQYTQFALYGIKG